MDIRIPLQNNGNKQIQEYENYQSHEGIHEAYSSYCVPTSYSLVPIIHVILVSGPLNALVIYPIIPEQRLLDIIKILSSTHESQS